MAVLVTGAGGFVGGYMMKHEGVIPLRTPSKKRINLCNRSQLQDFFSHLKLEGQKIGQVIHLAAQSHVPTSFLKPEETFSVNFLGTYNLLNALKDAGFCGKFLYVGSSESYGLVGKELLPIVETAPLKPRNPYAVSKVSAEALCYQWSLLGQFEIIMARPFNHIGPLQSERFVVSNFAKQVMQVKLKKQDTIEVGDLLVTRDFTDVRDVIKAYMLLLERGENGEVYNVCSGVERSLQSVLQELLNLAGVQASIEVAQDLVRKVEQRRIYGSAAKLHKQTGWAPKIPFSQTLEDILLYWEQKFKN